MTGAFSSLPPVLVMFYHLWFTCFLCVGQRMGQNKMKKDEQIMCEVLQRELASSVRDVWSPDASTSSVAACEPEITLDSMIEATEEIKKLMPRVYYGVSKAGFTGKYLIFKPEYCKNGEENYLIHPNNEEEFVAGVRKCFSIPICIEVKDMLKLPLLDDEWWSNLMKLVDAIP